MPGEMLPPRNSFFLFTKLYVMAVPSPITRLFISGKRSLAATTNASLSAPIVSGFPTGVVTGSIEWWSRRWNFPAIASIVSIEGLWSITDDKSDLPGLYLRISSETVSSLAFSRVTTSRRSGPLNTPHFSRVLPKSKQSVTVAWTMIIKKKNKQYIEYQLVLHFKCRFKNTLRNKMKSDKQQQKIFRSYCLP